MNGSSSHPFSQALSPLSPLHLTSYQFYSLNTFHLSAPPLLSALLPVKVSTSRTPSLVASSLAGKTQRPTDLFLDSGDSNGINCLILTCLRNLLEEEHVPEGNILKSDNQ